MSSITKGHIKEKMLLTYMLLAVFALIIIDASIDLLEKAPLKDLIRSWSINLTILIIILTMVNFIWKKLILEKKAKEVIEDDLIQTRKQASIWEKKSQHYTDEYHRFINQQFEKWNLSKSEKEIAHLLLLGMSSKEMATRRFTSERTIRNQCRSIYEKSAFSNKNELSGFFLKQLIKDFTPV